MAFRQFDSDEITVGTSFTTLTEQDLETGGAVVAIEVDNASGGQALSDYQVQVKSHPDAAWFTVLSASELTEGGHDLVMSADGSLGSLASGSKANFQIVLSGYHSFRTQAKVASSTATVRERGTRR